MFSHQSDDEIVANVVAYQRELSAYVHSLLPGDPSVPDIVQEVSIVAWKKRSSFKKGTNFRAWIFAIARLEVRAFRKQRQRKSWLVIDDELIDQITEAMEAPEDDLTEVEMRAALEHCIGRLDSKEKALIESRYYKEGTLEEYASSQGKTVGSIKVTLFRIRAALRKCIDREVKGKHPTAI